jgi:hypothetical protein
VTWHSVLTHLPVLIASLQLVPAAVLLSHRDLRAAVAVSAPCAPWNVCCTRVSSRSDTNNSGFRSTLASLAPANVLSSW